MAYHWTTSAKNDQKYMLKMHFVLIRFHT